MTTTLTSIDDLVSQMSLLKHRFYQRWSMGELTLDELRIYAKEYFHLVKRIPGIVERVRIRAVERGSELADAIAHNKMEEQEHVELWKRFAKSLGIDEATLMNHTPSMTVQSAVTELEMLADGSLEDGVTAMYSLEVELPKIAQTKKEGLCDFYGLSSEDAQIYFDEHLKEEEHIKVWRDVPVDSVRSHAVAEASLSAQNRVLDGVCELCGIGDC